MELTEKKRKFKTILMVRHRNFPEEWIEVENVNLGSRKMPNTDILEVKVEVRQVIDFKEFRDMLGLG
jgi:hypothetical protein